MSSPFIHRFTSVGRYFIYDVNTNAIFEVDRQFYDLIDEVDWSPVLPGSVAPAQPVLRGSPSAPPTEERVLAAQEVLAALETYNNLYGAFSAHRPRQIKFPIEPSQLPRVYPEVVRHLILCVTESCNLRCTYCTYSGTYQHNRVHSNKMMSEETALRGVDFLMAHSGYLLDHTEDPLYLGFYGGEPLLNHALIASCIRHLDTTYPARRARVLLSMTSNLTCATPAVLRFLADNEIELTVSLDGPDAIHNRYRKTHSGGGSVSQVRHNLEWLRDNAPEYYSAHVAFNAVLTPPFDLPHVVEFFETDELVRGHRVALALVNTYDTMFLESVGLSDWDWKTYEAQMAELRRRFIAGICSRAHIPNGPLESLFGGQLATIVDRDVYPLTDTIYPGGTCLPGCQRTFVSTDGRFYTCEKVNEHLLIGDLSADYSYIPIGELIAKFEELGKDLCTNCWACRLCGNCFATVLNGNDLDRDRMIQSCSSKKKAINQALEDYAEIATVTNADVRSVFSHTRQPGAVVYACRYLNTPLVTRDMSL